MSITNSAIAFYGVPWVYNTSIEPGVLERIDEQSCYGDLSDEVKDCLDILREHDIYVGKYGNGFTGDLSTYLYIPESFTSTPAAQPVKVGSYLDEWQARMESALNQLGIDDPTLVPGWYVAAEIY